MLHSIITDYSRVFIISDALDECEVSDGSRRRFLTEIFNLQNHTQTSLFVTSRTILEIKKEFEGCISLEIRASDEDVRKYIDCHISRLPSFVRSDLKLQEESKATITRAVHGM